MADNQTPPTAEQLDARIANAEQARANELKARNYTDAAFWAGKIEILTEWLASLRHTIATFAIACLALLVAAPVSAQKDCSLTSNFTFAPTQTASVAAGLAIASEVTPRLGDGTVVPFGYKDPVTGETGKIGIAIHGMSTCYQMQPFEIMALQSALRVKNAKGNMVLPPEFAIIGGCQQGMATAEWNGEIPGRDPWVPLASLIAKAGLTPAQIQVAYGMHAVRDLDVTNRLSPDRVTGVMEKFASRYPNTKLHFMSELPNGFGAGMPFIVDDGYTLAELARTQQNVPIGGWADYIQVASKPLDCALDTKPEGYHLTRSGGIKIGTFIGRDLAAHPVFRKAVGLPALVVEPEAPTEEETDPDPPVTVPVSGAVTKSGAGCILTVTVPSGTLMTTPVPTSWCSGL